MPSRSAFWRLPAACALVLSASVAGADPSSAQPALEVQRVAGADRVGTAVAVARDQFPAGAGAAVLATSRDFADALTGAALADHVGGPLLLTDRSALDPRVAGDLREHLRPGSTVWVLGGSTALSGEVETAVSSLGLVPRRIAGVDRYSTAAAVAAELGAGGAACEVVIATGSGFADGASAAGMTSASRPLLYSEGRTLPAPTRQALARCDGGVLTAVGGQAASAVEALGASQRSGFEVTVVAGEDRYETSALLLSRTPSAGTGAVPRGSAGTVVLANGEDYADALVGGTYGRPVLLTQPAALPRSVAAALEGVARPVRKLVVVGGPSAVSDDTARTASSAASGEVRTDGALADHGTWLSGAAGQGVASGQFGAWRGRPVEIAGTWADSNTAMVELPTLQPGRELGSWEAAVDVAVGAIGPSESWAEAAGGAYDGRWRTSLTKLAAARGRHPGTTYIRFAHEMNGDWYPWSVTKDDKDDFIAAWKRFRLLQKEVFPRAKLVFAVNRESVGSGIDWRETFPGRQHVDVMGVDYYNQFPYVDTVAGWEASVRATDRYGAPKGLQAHLDFARSVGLPLGVPEWSGHADNGDSPVFVSGMHDFFRTNAGSGAGQLHYEVLFNMGKDGGRWALYGGAVRMPRSAQTYRDLW